MFERTFVVPLEPLGSVEGLAFEVVQGVEFLVFGQARQDAGAGFTPGAVAVAPGLEDGIDEGAVADDGTPQ